MTNFLKKLFSKKEKKQSNLYEQLDKLIEQNYKLIKQAEEYNKETQLFKEEVQKIKKTKIENQLRYQRIQKNISNNIYYQDVINSQINKCLDEDYQQIRIIQQQNLILMNNLIDQGNFQFLEYLESRIKLFQIKYNLKIQRKIGQGLVIKKK